MKIFEPTVATAFVAGAASCALTYAGLQMMLAKEPPFKQSGKILKLFIYPIKSLPAVEVADLMVTKQSTVHKGFVRDREFMLLDAKAHTFITARDEPSLLLITVEIDYATQSLKIGSRNPGKTMSELMIPLLENKAISAKELQVSTWDKENPYKAMVCTAQICDWFSEYLGRDVYLIRHKQLLGKGQAPPPLFQDCCAMNYLSEASVKAVRDVVNNPQENITHRNFRPSILVDTKYPFEEDHWLAARIGSMESKFLQRCDRCVLTTINPDTAEKTMKEPLNALRKFRVDRSVHGIEKYKFRPLLSTQHTITNEGNIKIGDIIYARKADRDLL